MKKGRSASRKKSSSSNALHVVSMTGYGRALVKRGALSVEVEVKAVNSRYLDCALKLPRQYSGFEPELRELAGSLMQRGRVEISVVRGVDAALQEGLRFDKQLFDQYVKLYRSLQRELGVRDPSVEKMVHQILSRREVLDVGEGSVEVEKEKAVVWEAVSKALSDLDAMRRKEGQRLGADMLQRVSVLRLLRAGIAKKAERAPEELQKRLEERMRKLLSGVDVDQGRLCTEAALLAEKVDVSEELVRLDSHFEQFEAALKSSPNGRKLDFLLQEFGREFNTISSKAQDAAVQGAVVDAKTEIEKLREQVQNVE